MSAVPATTEEIATSATRSTTGAATGEGRYALALYEFAAQNGTLAAVEADMAALATVIADNKELRRTLNHPLITRTQQTKVLDALAQKMNANESTKKFLALVAAKKRQAYLPGIIIAFQAEAAARRGEVIAHVTSAAPLSPAQETELARVLSAKHKADVKLQISVDETLLGGMQIKIGSRLYDRTIKSQLAVLQHTLEQAA